MPLLAEARPKDRPIPRVKHLHSDPLLLAQQPEQQVVGADAGVVELARLGEIVTLTYLCTGGT